MNSYAEGTGWRLIQGDTLQVLKRFNEQIDSGEIQAFRTIFADPPYKLSNGGITCHAGQMVSVNKGEWDKSRGVKADHEFNLQWLEACRNILHEDGTVWVSGTYHVIYSIGFAAQELGYKILNDIAWYKPNASPNLSCRYFTASHETILWLAKHQKSKHTFNYQEMKRLNGGKQMRSVWRIPTPPPSEKVYGKHPTQKPIELLRRIILASTSPGELILDPFAGSGTTGVAALELGRKFIGVDISEEFLALACKRLTSVQLTLLGQLGD